MAESIFAGLNQEETQLLIRNALLSIIKSEDSPHISGESGLLVLGMRNDTDTSTADDGDLTVLKLDEQGRLKVSSKPASYSDITGSITAIQASMSTPVAGGTVEGDVSRASNVVMFCSGTFSAVNVSFEGSLESSGDTNWFTIQAVRSNANTIETATGSLSAQPTYAWELSVNALKRVRVRCTARTSGTQNWRFVLGTYATEPIPAMQSHAVTLASIALAPSASYGSASYFHLISANTVNSTLVKSSAGLLNNLIVSNNGASPVYLKLYNKASAPTVGTDTPIMTIMCPANSTIPVNLAPYGVRFSTGIGYGITTGIAVNDTGVIGASQVAICGSYT